MTWNTNPNGGAWGPSSDTQSADIWGGFKDIPARPARNAFLPAGLNTIATIEELKVVSSQKNVGQKVFVAVLSVEQDGERFSYDWVAKMTERPYLQAIKSLMCSLNPEADPSYFGSDVMNHVTGPEQPLKGERVRVRTELILTTRGSEFTKVHWSPAS